MPEAPRNGVRFVLARVMVGLLASFFAVAFRSTLHYSTSLSRALRREPIYGAELKARGVAWELTLEGRRVAPLRDSHPRFPYGRARRGDWGQTLAKRDRGSTAARLRCASANHGERGRRSSRRPAPRGRGDTASARGTRRGCPWPRNFASLRAEAPAARPCAGCNLD
jgi:hypothetical protein